MSVNSSLIRDRMLDRVSHSQAHFKSQQQGESDLTFGEKRLFAENLLDRNVVLFLQRFHKFLILEDLNYFNPHKESYEVGFYLEEVRRENDTKKKMLKVKNRRYEAMQRLIKDGDYFSDVNMRERMPHLYDQMIGRYLTDEEKHKMFSEESEITFSGFLLNAIEKERVEQTRRCQEEEEDCAEEESESEENTDDEDQVEMQTEDKDDTDDLRMKPKISSEEKEMLRHEFTSIMFQQFLSGKDKYDYRLIDENSELDAPQMCDIDEEEKYFDSEDPS